MMPVNDKSVVEVGILGKDNRSLLAPKPNIAVIMEETHSRNNIDITSGERTGTHLNDGTTKQLQKTEDPYEDIHEDLRLRTSANV
jgi:hypothetical protein